MEWMTECQTLKQTLIAYQMSQIFLSVQFEMSSARAVLALQANRYVNENAPHISQTVIHMYVQEKGVSAIKLNMNTVCGSCGIGIQSDGSFRLLTLLVSSSRCDRFMFSYDDTDYVHWMPAQRDILEACGV